MKISLLKIKPDPKQPRKLFDAAALNELAESIKANDLIQPITVRPDKKRGHYIIVAGERRYRAHVLLRDRGVRRFASIEANVRNVKVGADVLIKQIIENVQREDMTPLEEADSFQELRDTFGMDADEIATKLGLAPFRVRWRLLLLNLSADIRKMVASGDLDRQQAMEVARIENHADQARIVRLINRGHLVGWKSVRNAVDAILEGTTQADIFGSVAPASKAEDLKVVRSMEGRVDQIAAVVAMGWREGQCIVASRVSPDRAALMADKLAGIKSAIAHMERELRHVGAQAKIVMAG
ncbi:ParB/RepB/Spo0J family partition protein [Bradyrhizobium sp. LjRoot220]|uniref:ParB/RepB/Spo0J family partition protein n=1 Tax=Bradyrhizobium sp. LjRoot220 TaxID=3342284 RepID=UPI003ECF4CF3